MDSTVAKGLAVLEHLARSDQPVRLTTLAEDLGLQKSNCHRLLTTLVALGFVTRDPATRRYAPTLRLWELGAGVAARHPVRQAVYPYIHDLHRKTGETVTLSVLEGHELLVLDKMLAPRSAAFLSREGSRLPATVNAGGRVMLAYEPDAPRLVETILAAAGRDDDPQATLDDLSRIRAAGYAIGRSQRSPGVIGVAAAIPTRNGRSTASLMVSGPAERLEKRLPMVIEETCRVCANIASAAGRL